MNTRSLTAFLGRPVPLALATLAACTVAAQPMPGAPASYAFDESSLRAFVSRQAASALGESATRFEVRLGPVSAAMGTLAPCQRAEPFIPAGARLWGRSSLGLRCVEGAGWTVMLPLTVSVWGRASVAALDLAAGSVLSAADLREEEIELTREAGAPARDPQALVGRTLTRAVNAGQPMRADMVRVTAVLQAGDPVRLRITGAGFAVTATGQALAAAGEGASVRVRTDLGKVLTGIAREGRQVDVAL